MTVGHLLMFALGFAVGACVVSVQWYRAAIRNRALVQRLAQISFDAGKVFGVAVATSQHCREPDALPTYEVDPADRWKLG